MPNIGVVRKQFRELKFVQSFCDNFETTLSHNHIMISFSNNLYRTHKQFLIIYYLFISYFSNLPV